VHEAFEGESVEAVVHEGGDFGLIDVEQFGGGYGPGEKQVPPFGRNDKTFLKSRFLTASPFRNDKIKSKKQVPPFGRNDKTFSCSHLTNLSTPRTCDAYLVLSF
jgi:hypothetical protein